MRSRRFKTGLDRASASKIGNVKAQEFVKWKRNKLLDNALGSQPVTNQRSQVLFGGNLKEMERVPNIRAKTFQMESLLGIKELVLR